jgi:hypothetical protein
MRTYIFNHNGTPYEIGFSFGPLASYKYIVGTAYVDGKFAGLFHHNLKDELVFINKEKWNVHHIELMLAFEEKDKVSPKEIVLI